MPQNFSLKKVGCLNNYSCARNITLVTQRNCCSLKNHIILKIVSTKQGYRKSSRFQEIPPYPLKHYRCMVLGELTKF